MYIVHFVKYIGQETVADLENIFWSGNMKKIHEVLKI